MIIKNYMEDIVFDAIDSAVHSLNVCNCEQCRYDMASIVLNAIQPKYVATKKGELYTKISVLQRQFEVDIVTALTKAAEIVRNNPRHK